MMNKRSLWAFIFIVLFSALQAVAASTKMRPITLEWDPVADAAKYEIEITGADDHLVAHQTLKESFWKGQLPLGRYRFRVRSLDERSAVSPWSEPTPVVISLPRPKPLSPTPNQKLLSNQTQTESVHLTWRAVELAEKYAVEVRDSSQKSIVKEVTTHTNDTVSLPVGQRYTWNVQAQAKDESSPQPADNWSSFEIRGGPLSLPSLFPVKEPSAAQVSWSPVENAQSYRWRLLKRDSQGSWQLLEEHDQWKLTQVQFSQAMTTGEYRIEVLSQSPFFADSSPSSLDFKHSQQGETSQANATTYAVPEGQTQIERRNLLTLSLGDVGTHIEILHAASFTGAQVTGYSLSLDWIHAIAESKADFEFFLQADQYASNGVSLTPLAFFGDYERPWFSSDSFKWGAGFFGLQLADINAGSSSALSTLQLINTFGPQLTTSLQGHWSAKWDWRLKAQLLVDLFGLPTPNAQAEQFTYGYRLSNQEVWRLSEKIPLVFGVAFESNSIVYPNSNPTGLGLPLNSTSSSSAQNLEWTLGTQISF